MNSVYVRMMVRRMNGSCWQFSFLEGSGVLMGLSVARGELLPLDFLLEDV